MCVESREWMKFGGKAFFCFTVSGLLQRKTNGIAFQPAWLVVPWRHCWNSLFGDIKCREDLRQSDKVKVWRDDDITEDISLIYSDLIPHRHRIKHQKLQWATGGCFLNVSDVKVVVLVVEAVVVRVLWLSFQIQFNDDWCKTWTITDDIKKKTPEGFKEANFLPCKSNWSRLINREAEMQQHALFRARTKPTPRRWLCFGNTNQSEGARVQARCKNSTRAALLLETRCCCRRCHCWWSCQCKKHPANLYPPVLIYPEPVPFKSSGLPPTRTLF